nr:hypothetical protein [Marinicella sp. W31]MDC2877965.1 hypothetical protein [Marinicella sp. W31]
MRFLSCILGFIERTIGSIEGRLDTYLADLEFRNSGADCDRKGFAIMAEYMAFDYHADFLGNKPSIVDRC